jgi:outer membrane protein assembly factor BamA
LLFVSVSLYAQTDTTYTIAKIKISGNYKTAIQIIEREIDVYVGESISHPELISKLNSIQNRIFNTGLFVLVKYDIDSLPNQHITIHILVKERWYTYIIMSGGSKEIVI